MSRVHRQSWGFVSRMHGRAKASCPECTAELGLLWAQDAGMVLGPSHSLGILCSAHWVTPGLARAMLCAGTGWPWGCFLPSQW